MAVSFSTNGSSAMFLPIAYLAMSQDTAPPSDFRIVVRADVPPASLTPVLTRAITEVVPAASVSYGAVTTYIERLLITERLMAWLSGFFGVVAMLIAAIGLYGLMSYIVAHRRVEIGVHMALGAEPRTVIRMMLAESGRLLALGIVIGVALAAIALRYAEAPLRIDTLRCDILRACDQHARLRKLAWGVAPRSPRFKARSRSCSSRVGLICC